MKLRDMIKAQVKDLGGAGVVARYLTITPRGFELLVQEVHGDNTPAAMAELDRTRSDGTVMFGGLEVVFADLPRFMPCGVSGAVQDELDFYNFKSKP